jgi:predicted nucleic acid-binding protein
MPAVIDSNLLYAWRNRNDALHGQGRDVVNDATDEQLPKLHVPDVLFQETVKHIHNELGYQECIRTIDYLIENPQVSIITLTDGDLTRGRALFRRNDELELPDAITVAYMRREQIEYIYSCDDDFDRFDDITRFTQSINPHSP